MLQGKAEPVGCDDLLPIIAFVVLRSGMNGLVTELSYMVCCIEHRWGPLFLCAHSRVLAQEEFVDDACLNNEEGYALATVQVAVEYLLGDDLSLSEVKN